MYTHLSDYDLSRLKVLGRACHIGVPRVKTRECWGELPDSFVHQGRRERAAIILSLDSAVMYSFVQQRKVKLSNRKKVQDSFSTVIPLTMLEAGWTRVART